MRKIWWVGSFEPGKSNVGDHAQTLAIRQFLTDQYPESEVKQYYRNELGEFLRQPVEKDDLILINSSGDFGDRYPQWHIQRRAILYNFPDNQIIQLPTTVYYKSEKMLEDDKEFWNKPNYTILCREPRSYEIASSNFNCNTAFFPDFVFYLRPSLLPHINPTALQYGTHLPRPEGAFTNPQYTYPQGVLVNLREDGESKLSVEDREIVTRYAEDAYDIVDSYDAHKLKQPITEDIREKYINDLFKMYQGKELIVTDMMHGMIFAIINRIPCVALDDAIPHKISGYKELVGNSVVFADTIHDIPYCINKIKDIYEPMSLHYYFKEFNSLCQ